jgi:hypothetical protein
LRPLPLYSRYPLDRRLDGPHSRSGRSGKEKILYPTGTRTPTPSVVQPVAIRYTDYAIQAPRVAVVVVIIVEAIHLEPRQNVLSALYCTALCLIASLVTIAVSPICAPYKTTSRLSSVSCTRAYSLPTAPLLPRKLQYQPCEAHR